MPIAYGTSLTHSYTPATEPLRVARTSIPESNASRGRCSPNHSDPEPRRPPAVSCDSLATSALACNPVPAAASAPYHCFASSRFPLARPAPARLFLRAASHALRPCRTDCFATIRIQPRTTPGIQPLRHEGGRLEFGGGARRPTPLVFDQQWLSSYWQNAAVRSANRSLSVEITAWVLWIEDVDEDAPLDLITKSPSPPTVPYLTQSTRSACPSISAEPPSSPAAAALLSPTPREPPSAPDTRRPPHYTRPPRCPSLAELSRTQPPQKRYHTVNQPIPEVADDS